MRVIAVTGGKGGVGKTHVSINLAIALSRLSQRVLLLDADLSLANIDVSLGLSVEKNLEDVVSGACHLSEIVVEGPQGLRIIPASSGAQSMARLGHREQAGLINGFAELAADIDVLIVDTAAGISNSVVSFVRASQEVVVVVCDEPTSITDAYAQIKLFSTHHGISSFRIVANQTRGERKGRALYQRLCSVANRFLDVVLHYEGAIPFDEAVRKAVRQQQAVLDAYPGSAAAKAFAPLAKKTLQWPLPSGPSGYLQFFVEQLLDAQR